MVEPILDVKDLDVSFTFPDGQYKAIDSLSFTVHSNEVVGIVGESGCGKTLTSLAIMGMLPDNASITNGSICFRHKRQLVGLSEKEWQSIRGRAISMIFQEPMTALNPVYPVGKQISEVLIKHTKQSRKAIKEQTIQLMKQVGLPRAEALYHSYPHQLSGGMRQRIVIAMALIGEPDLIIADEPTTALDVTIQSQIIQLFRKLKQEKKVSMLFISHDWGVLSQVCDRVLVLYAGQLVEAGPISRLVDEPLHPYTKGLIRSIPDRAKRGEPLYTIPGRVPPLKERHRGCPFYDRCRERMEICRTVRPKTVNIKEQMVQCHLYTEEMDVPSS